MGPFVFVLRYSWFYPESRLDLKTEGFFLQVETRMNRKLAPLFILSLTLLNACGGGGGSNAGGGGGTGPQSISVNFSALPPQSMTVGDNVGVSATVTNDSANAGVNWSCTPTGACGTFTPTSTASGANTMYVAPGAVPSGGKVMIVATSVTDSTKNAQAPVTITAPTQPAIVVSISTTPTPPATMSVSTTTQVSTAQIAATVTNDSANAGVNWSCTPTPSCGSSSSFSLNPTPSGTATTYTAPSSVPSGGAVTLTATSVTDPTKSAPASVLITGTASVGTLNGQYAFIVSAPTGNPVSRGITTWEGSIAFDGHGNIPSVTFITVNNQQVGVGGVEDIVAPQYNDQADPILATVAGQSPTTHYTLDASGHGTLVMLTQHGETLNMSFVVTSPTHAVVIELDGEPGSGTLDRQTPASGGFSASQISGGYSFTMVGIDAIAAPPASPPSLSYGGIFTANGSSLLTSGTIDINNGSPPISSTQFLPNSSFVAPDVNYGRGTLQIVLPGSPPAGPGSRTFIYYLVSPKVLRLLENDNIAYMGGSAYAQGSASTALSGNYVYQHSGWNPASANPSTGRTVGAGEFSVTSGSGSFSGGISDANTTSTTGGLPTTGSPGTPISSGSYSIPATLNGTLAFTDATGACSFNMYMVDPTLNILDPNNTTGTGGALLLHTDGLVNGTGILILQQTASAFLGKYALNLNNSIAGMTSNELDLVGILTGDGSSSFGTSNLADYDQVNRSILGTPDNPMLGGPLSGTFSINSGHPGRATGSVTVGPPSTAPTPYGFIPPATGSVTLSVVFYQVSATESFIVETDTQANVSGYLVQQQLP